MWGYVLWVQFICYRQQEISSEFPNEAYRTLSMMYIHYLQSLSKFIPQVKLHSRAPFAILFLNTQFISEVIPNKQFTSKANLFALYLEISIFKDRLTKMTANSCSVMRWSYFTVPVRDINSSTRYSDFLDKYIDVALSKPFWHKKGNNKNNCNLKQKLDINQIDTVCNHGENESGWENTLASEHE